MEFCIEDADENQIEFMDFNQLYIFIEVFIKNKYHFQMFDVNIKYDPEEILVKNSKNVYTDGEFQLRLPQGFKLMSVPNMNWIQVEFYPSNYYLTFWIFGLIHFLFPASTDLSILQTALGPQSNCIYHQELSQNTQQKST